uniref:Uncharacterized protein n=1 Tax=Rangifer tarandus platyrhynchus TaxID=3082113 RepID=A0ACB0E710_RANTA|nr:unnamed protein product [Rangifer tarandus platyrhynchus]
MGSRRTECGRGGRSLQPQGKVNFHVARPLWPQVEYRPVPAATWRSRQLQLGFRQSRPSVGAPRSRRSLGALWTLILEETRVY